MPILSVGEIARLINGKVEGDPGRQIDGVANLGDAGLRDLAFAADSRALTQAARSRAGCILIPSGSALPGQTAVAVALPKLAFIQAAAALAPAAAVKAGVHPTAVVAPEALLDPGVWVGPHAVIERFARIGSGARLGSGVFVGEGVEIGEDSVLHPGVAVYAGARIGNRVVLHAGVVVGSDGFGYVFARGRHHKFPQLGSVIIEDDVEIGANTAVDRGSLGVTVIGVGTKIDNLVQIAHNVRIGRHCVIAAQTGISGSAKVGDHVVIGGQAGIAEHVVIEDGARIGAQSAVYFGKIVRKGSTVWGTPARPLDAAKRQYAHLSRLPSLARRVRELERRLSAGSSKSAFEREPQDNAT